jgi:heptosyltransferase I
MRILLVKTSSLGDVIHNLPVASDIARAFPQARIDWLVEAGFADIPRLHPAVDQVIAVAVRRWRKALFRRSTWAEIGAMRQALAEQHYDAVIDTQGLLKSAWLSRQAPGVRHGFDAASAREPLAARFYDHTHAVKREEHAVTRNRLLAGAALGYWLENGPDYGLDYDRNAGAIAVSPALTFGESAASSSERTSDFATLLTATSRDDKLWPEADWVALGRHLRARGLRCELPAGSAPERARAQRIAEQIPDARVLPPSSIAQLAQAMRPARLVVGVDTGLVHLAAALARPTIALYCTSRPALTGVLAGLDRSANGSINSAPTSAINLGDIGAPPPLADVIASADRLLDGAA